MVDIAKKIIEMLSDPSARHFVPPILPPGVTISPIVPVVEYCVDVEPCTPLPDVGKPQGYEPNTSYNGLGAGAPRNL